MRASSKLLCRVGFSASPSGLSSWRFGVSPPLRDSSALRRVGCVLLDTQQRTLAAASTTTRAVRRRSSSDTTVGLDAAELLFVDESEDNAYTSSNASASATGPSEYTTDPLPEPASEDARAALQKRRDLFARCTELHDVAQAELRAEVARDMQDGVAAVPPLAPAGWRVLHPTGSSYFTMSRVTKGGYSDSSRGVDVTAAGASRASSTPRYQSVHDMMSGHPSHRRLSSSPDKTAVTGQNNTRLLRDRDDLHAGRSGSGRGVCYARSDVHVTVFAPFRTLDLTLFDPTVDICEWTRFDVLVRKSKPSLPSSQTLQRPATPLAGQQEVWDEGRCMFLRLACVNGELRIRSVQFLSQKLARALEEHAVFGRGDPLYLELLRRQRHERAVSRAGHQDRWHTAASPLHVFDAPGPTATPELSSSDLLLDPLLTAASGDGGKILTSQFDRSGEYARMFAYGGPYLTELSKELREALQEYVMMNVGISNEVAEYVCQMQFFLEQEEYVGWLAQWGQLATTLRQTL